MNKTTVRNEMIWGLFRISFHLVDKYWLHTFLKSSLSAGKRPNEYEQYTNMLHYAVKLHMDKMLGK